MFHTRRLVRVSPFIANLLINSTLSAAFVADDEKDHSRQLIGCCAGPLRSARPVSERNPWRRWPTSFERAARDLRQTLCAANAASLHRLLARSAWRSLGSP